MRRFRVWVLFPRVTGRYLGEVRMWVFSRGEEFWGLFPSGVGDLEGKRGRWRDERKMEGKGKKGPTRPAATKCYVLNRT